LAGKHREPPSINAKLFLPIIPIGIVACAFTTFVETAVLLKYYDNDEMQFMAQSYGVGPACAVCKKDVIL